MIVCRNLEKIISRNQYNFLGIQNPLEAVPFIIKNPPDLIFLDLMMPIINGYELCSQLRIIPNFKNIPIIILTGKDGLIDRLRARVVGATDFISKNSTSEEILKILDKYLP